MKKLCSIFIMLMLISACASREQPLHGEIMDLIDAGHDAKIRRAARKGRFNNYDILHALQRRRTRTALTLIEHARWIDEVLPFKVKTRRGLEHGRFAPIHLAALQGQVEVLQALIDKGADVNLEGNLSAEVHGPPVAFALNQGRYRAAYLLLAAGSVTDPGNIPIRRKKARELLKDPFIFLQKYSIGRYRDMLLKSAKIHITCDAFIFALIRERSRNIRDFFIKQPELAVADCQYNGEKITPISYARKHRLTQLPRILREADDIHHIQDRQGRSLLYHAVAEDLPALTKKLLEYGGYKMDALMLLAAGHGSVNALRVLVEKASPEGVRDKAGNSLLALAVASGNLYTVRLLLGYPKFRHQVNNQGENALFPIISMQGSLKEDRPDESRQIIIQQLKKGGVHINHRNVDGRTALHMAVLHNDKKAVRWLVDAGASVSIRDKQNRLPFDYFTESDIRNDSRTGRLLLGRDPVLPLVAGNRVDYVIKSLREATVMDKPINGRFLLVEVFIMNRSNKNQVEWNGGNTYIKTRRGELRRKWALFFPRQSLSGDGSIFSVFVKYGISYYSKIHVGETVYGDKGFVVLKHEKKTNLKRDMIYFNDRVGSVIFDYSSSRIPPSNVFLLFPSERKQGLSTRADSLKIGGTVIPFHKLRQSLPAALALED